MIPKENSAVGTHFSFWVQGQNLTLMEGIWEGALFLAKPPSLVTEGSEASSLNGIQAAGKFSDFL